jgi:hypothetical protein
MAEGPRLKSPLGTRETICYRYDSARFPEIIP